MVNHSFVDTTQIEHSCDPIDIACTFNIPARLYFDFMNKVSQFECLESYLIFLLNCCRNMGHLSLPNTPQLTSCYQSKDLDLQRQDFKCDSFLWHEFKCLARLRGFSMCHFFVILLQMDLDGQLKKQAKKVGNGVPTYRYHNYSYFEVICQKIFKYQRGIGPAPPRKNI